MAQVQIGPFSETGRVTDLEHAEVFAFYELIPGFGHELVVQLRVPGADRFVHMLALATHEPPLNEEDEEHMLAVLESLEGLTPAERASVLAAAHELVGVLERHIEWVKQEQRTALFHALLIVEHLDPVDLEDLADCVIDARNNPAFVVIQQTPTEIPEPVALFIVVETDTEEGLGRAAESFLVHHPKLNLRSTVIGTPFEERLNL